MSIHKTPEHDPQRQENAPRYIAVDVQAEAAKIREARERKQNPQGMKSKKQTMPNQKTQGLEIKPTHHLPSTGYTAVDVQAEGAKIREARERRQRREELQSKETEIKLDQQEIPQNNPTEQIQKTETEQYPKGKLAPIVSKQGQKPPITTREGKLGPVVKSSQGVHSKVVENSLKPVNKKRKPNPNKYWNFKEFKEAYAEKVDESELTPQEQSYFDDYAKQAQYYLDRPNTKWQGNTPLNGQMFAEAAKRMYLRYGKDMSKVVPLEMALSQAQFESHFGLSGRSAEKNPFNIGEYNTSTADFVKEIEDASMGVAIYYHLMAEDYLSAKKPEQLLQDFTNERGNRYQVNDNGVVDHKYEKRLRIQIDYIQRMLKQMPGGYTPTFRPSVATHQTTAHKPKASKITHVPLPKSTSGFSVGMPGGKYTTSMINFPEDVRRMQQKLLEVGLLSEADYAQEYPQEKKAKILAQKPAYSDIQKLNPQGLQEAKNQEKGILAQQKADAEAKNQATLQQARETLLSWLQSLTDAQVRSMAETPALSTVLGELVLRSGLMGVSSRGEMISQLMVLRGQGITPLSKQEIPTPPTPPPPEVPYVHYLTDFEQAAMDAYGKVPVGDPIPVAQLPKTIAAIEVFQREVKGGTVDGRIDPGGITLGQLMGASKESVTVARKMYLERKKQETEDKKKEVIIEQLKTLIADIGEEIQKELLPVLEKMPWGSLVKLLRVLVSSRKKEEVKPSNENKELGPVMSEKDFSSQKGDPSGCYRKCVAMLRKRGYGVLGGFSEGYQTLKENLSATKSEVLTENTKKAIKYIDTTLEAGKPVIVGVAHTPSFRPNAEYGNLETDHFIVVMAKKYDKDKKQYYYRYFDPGNYYKGTNENLRLYIGSDYSVSGVGGYNPNLTYKMSYVKKTVDLNK